MKNFLKKYGKILGLILIATLTITYLLGMFNKNISDGDWLSFWGSYLAFAGALFLGTVSIWQNEQANETNKKMIEENRRINQIQFKNELTKQKYREILNGINLVFNQTRTIVKKANENIKNTNIQQSISLLKSNLIEIELLRDIEIDSYIPLCYDNEFTYLAERKKAIKDNLTNMEKRIKENIPKRESYSQRGSAALEPYNDTIIIDSQNFLKLISCFKHKLDSIESYSSY